MVNEVVKELPNGFKILKAPDLYNTADKITRQDFVLVDPTGKYICHADNVADLEDEKVVKKFL